MPDPLDAITERGVRIVYLHDFDDQVYLVDDVGVMLIDAALPRETAASVGVDIIEHPEKYDSPAGLTT